jgi:hypothetical protein
LKNCSAEHTGTKKFTEGRGRPIGAELTEEEQRMNLRVLEVLEKIATWKFPYKYAKHFLANIQVDTAKYQTRPRDEPIECEPLGADATVKEVLTRILIYLWLVPRDEGCFHRSCDDQLKPGQTYLQHTHNRRRKGPTKERTEKKRRRIMFNCDSSLTS